MAEVSSQPIKDACEYRVEAFPMKMTDEDVVTLFNALGSQGWNLILFSNVITDDGYVRAWFKRELPIL
jgi:hypothetical protein